MSVAFVTNGQILTTKIFVLFHKTIIKTISYETLPSNNF